MEQFDQGRCRFTTILLVDDDGLIRDWMKSELAKDPCAQQFQVLEAENIASAFEILGRENIDVLVLDKNLSDSFDEIKNDGINYIPEILKLRPNTQVIVHTSSDEMDDIIRAIKFGAFSYVTKGSELFVSQILKALEFSQLALDRTQAQLGGVDNFQIKTISKSLSMRKVVNEIDAFSASDWPVLLLGESGVGKTTIAQMMFQKRKLIIKNPSAKFYSISLAGMHKDSVVRELFGSEPGAYTGSLKTHMGYFEVASGGTLFIDEIGEISPEVQTLLLKAIDEKQITRMGSTTPIKTDFKLICATNRNLFEMVEKGEFREDLFMRISKSTIQVPALSERKEDIPELLKGIFPKVLKEARLFGLSDKIPEDFIKALTENPPRGNIRGLERAIGDLLVYAPKDSSGKTVLALWATVPELLKYAGADQAHSRTAKPLNFKELKSAEFKMADDKFPGLDQLLLMVEKKILQEFGKKFRRNVDRAKALKIDPTRCARRYHQIGMGVMKSPAIKDSELSH